uniref:DUF8206 domain-containing protein n=1 Tax=Globodera pallida TaxID=36090 RepID=A0A183CKN6_GLOPA
MEMNITSNRPSWVGEHPRRIWLPPTLDISIPEGSESTPEPPTLDISIREGSISVTISSKKPNARYSEEDMVDFSKSWTRAEQELQRMLKYVRTILTIQNNFVRVKAREKLIRMFKEQQAAAPVFQTVRYAQFRHPRIGCTSDCCAEMMDVGGGNFMLYMDSCHVPCYCLEIIPPDCMPNESLKNCRAALFSCFLKKWAMEPYTDTVEAYIQSFIQHEKQMADGSNDAADHEFHTKLLKGLEESLRLYREQKELFENAKSDDANTSGEVTAEDIQQQARLNHQKEYTEKKVVTGLVPKPSRNINAAVKQAKEQHLNKLEKGEF